MPVSFPPPTNRPRDAAEDANAKPAIDRASPAIELRLAIGRGGLGLELARPARIACVEITELDVALPGVRFPLDVTGGVARFRHRRGELKRVALEISAGPLERWAAPRLRGIIGTETPTLWIGAREGGAIVSLANDAGTPRVLVFEVMLLASGADVRLVVTRARGAGLTQPATALAIAAMDALLAKRARRDGATFTIANAPGMIARTLLPDAGARAPSDEGVAWSSFGAHGDAWVATATIDGSAIEPSASALRAREASEIARDGDDARLAGDLTRARALDLAALERAPGHVEIAHRIAEIDALAGGRAEAALATLREARGDEVRGVLVAELLADAGDIAAAIAAFARAGEDEPAPALAARAFERAAALSADPLDALTWLDAAIARAPTIARLYWLRVGRRLAAGRIDDARADVAHIEALASGARAKHAVWQEAGDAWLRAGLRGESSLLFERALRYLPDDPAALAGLGRALADDGRASRGAALLARAIELSGASPASQWSGRDEAVIALAEILEGRLGDRPAAIARVRSVSASSPDAIEARALEGRWRAAMGDLAGASLAFARMRESIATLAESVAAARASRFVPWLVEAAKFERDVRDDLHSAQQHLGAALRLRPRDAAIQDEYRTVGARLATPEDATPIAPNVEASFAHAARDEALTDDRDSEGDLAPSSRDEAPRALAIDLGDEEPSDDSAAAARVEELTQKFQMTPNDDAIFDELVPLLERLGRGHELFALLQSRIEDASPERRAQLLPSQRAVLERLEKSARAAGRNAEADLFRDARAMLD